MHRWNSSTILIALLGLTGCQASSDLRVESVAANRLEVAERYFRAVYTGRGDGLDDLVAPDIVVSYPIFQDRFGTPALRGREAVKNFARGFGSRWSDAEVIIYDSVVDEEAVVLVWSFRARWMGPNEGDGEDVERSWGGITLIKFDEQRRVIMELGEESEPGPSGRLGAAD